jgi:hypothetical protein
MLNPLLLIISGKKKEPANTLNQNEAEPFKLSIPALKSASDHTVDQKTYLQVLLAILSPLVLTAISHSGEAALLQRAVGRGKDCPGKHEDM